MFNEGPIPEEVIMEIIKASQTGIGAQTFFIGRVRPDKKCNSTVESIEFTAQKEIAENTAKDIISKSKEKYGILGAEIRHSLGKVNAGNCCFLVTVYGKHRKESFQALEFIVNEVKSRCPIFGKENLNNGSIKWKENCK